VGTKANIAARAAIGLDDGLTVLDSCANQMEMVERRLGWIHVLSQNFLLL
jgi:hypothetical protein